MKHTYNCAKSGDRIGASRVSRDNAYPEVYCPACKQRVRVIKFFKDASGWPFERKAYWIICTHTVTITVGKDDE